MIHIKIDFPAGRWHATAWGTHVNEGVPEWPPCPWRLCRALVAAWHWKHRRQDESILRGLLEKLAARLPEYALPEASSAHTRHFMPVITGKSESKTKVFDTFVQVNKGRSLCIRWSVSLSESEHALLGQLLGQLNYMGRAESLVIVTLLDDTDTPCAKDADFSAKPLLNGEPTDGEIIRLLAPRESTDYMAWQEAQQASSHGKKNAKSKTKSTLPETLFDALQFDTTDWKTDGWNLPPGSRWVEYTRPRDCFKIAPSNPRRRARANLPTVARFVVVSKVPPSITQALSLSERFHQALCKILERESHTTDDEREVLTGVSQTTGKPLEGGRHVFFLPECNDHGYVTHMTLHAPAGFGPAVCRIFGKLRKVWGAEGFDVKIVLLATGRMEDFALIVPYFRKSEKWTSLTPFFPVRHMKKKNDPGRNNLIVGSAAHDCWRLLETINAEKDWFDSLPDAAFPRLPILRVAPTDKPSRIVHGLRELPCLKFQHTRRTGNGTRASSQGSALTIEFREPVSLPIGIGYGAHFGLGLFVPTDPHTTTNAENSGTR